MLDYAWKYEREINDKVMQCWYTEKYKYYFTGTYNNVYQSELSKSGDDYRSREFASIDKSTGDVIGVISYRPIPYAKTVETFAAINFTDDTVTFGKDLHQVIDDIFRKFNFEILRFTVNVGNPIEEKYDKYVRKYNGRIVGIESQKIPLYDNTFVDLKIYEVYRKDYLTVVRDPKNDDPKRHILDSEFPGMEYDATSYLYLSRLHPQLNNIRNSIMTLMSAANDAINGDDAYDDVVEFLTNDLKLSQEDAMRLCCFCVPDAWIDKQQCLDTELRWIDDEIDCKTTYTFSKAPGQKPIVPRLQYGKE